MSVNEVPWLKGREDLPLEARMSPMHVAARGLALCTRGAASLFVFAYLAAGCGGSVDLKSNWLDRDVTVDGANTEWRGATTYFEDKELSVGLLNDDEFMYIALFVGDRQTQTQILMRGCTVWFDPKGEQEEVLGVHYPLGMMMGGGGSPARGRKMGQPRGFPDADSLRKIFAEQPKVLELLGPEPGELHTLAMRGNGIEVALQLHETSLIYEIKMPLAISDGCPYGIGAEPGGKISVGLMTPEIQRPSRPEGMGRGPGMGGGGGGRGGLPGGRGGMAGGGMRGGSRPEPPSPLEVWASIELAAAPQAGEVLAIEETE
jgi:hypothetical protein